MMILQMSSPSPEQIASARDAMLEERRSAGVRTVEIRCPHLGCEYVADGCGLTEGTATGQAVKEITRHILSGHGERNG